MPRARWLGAVVLMSALAGAGAVAIAWSPGEVIVNERCLATVDGATRDLAPEQAANAATITAIAVRRELPARAATIAVATAIQESKLRNLDYGDRDSLELFQQRPSQGWGTPEEILDPIYATSAFYDALVAVDGYEAMEITDASHRVQRSAFPDAVADHEPHGRAFASALAGYSPAAMTCRLRPADGAGSVAAVQALLARDLGDVATTADGSVVRIPVADGEEGRRRAWVLASWAVAHADHLDVVRVGADGRQWRRDDPAAGWTAAPDGAAAGEVVIEVAAAG